MALLATLFFSMTFILNRRLVVNGGHWAWAVVLRYIFTFMLLGPLVWVREGFGSLPRELQTHWRDWLLWSIVGFGIFGACLTWAASSGPAWLVAGTFQFTVIAGPLLAPFIYKDERRRVTFLPLSVGLLIISGVLAMEYGQATHLTASSTILPVLAVIISACAYPLGNRKVLLHLEECGCKLSTSQRVLGMTLMSMLLWIPLAIRTYFVIGPPSWSEMELAAGVATCSGVIATILFFSATEIVRQHRIGLAAVEAMQAGELLFSVLLGAILLRERWPHGISAYGAAGVILGIVMFSALSARETIPPTLREPA
jgi:drug/metabolite transporter (DMT)-like permease